MVDFELLGCLSLGLSSWDAWDECEVWIYVFLGLEKVWASLGLKWEKKIARSDFWFWSGCN